MFRTIINVSTGEKTQVLLTQEELDEIASRPPEPLPIYSCSPWQIRKALNQLSLRQAVEDAVAASGDITLKDGWSVATEFRSDDPFVIGMGAAIGKTIDETRSLIQLATTL